MTPTQRFYIRPYRGGDRQAVRVTCAGTAFFGDPLEAVFEDRELFNDAFSSYYTDLEPESLLVAEFDGHVGGYLMGCLDTRRHGKLWRGRILPGVVGRTLLGRYRLGRQTLRLGLRGAQALLRGDFVGADHDLYPAHLHINVAAPYRGQGAGRALMASYLEYLRAHRVPGVHLETSTQNRAARRLYESLGFDLLSSTETKLWQGVVDQPVQLLVYGKRLPAASMKSATSAFASNPGSGA